MEWLQLGMWDEIFKFESFIHFVIFLKYFKAPFLKFSLKFSLKFCILITIHL